MADEVMGDFCFQSSELIEPKLPLIDNLQVVFPHSTHLFRLLDQFAEVDLPEKKLSVVFRQTYTNATYKSGPLLQTLE